MPHTFRSALHRRLLAAVAPALLLAANSAAAPLPASDASAADLLYYKETFYSDASQTVRVGSGSGFCDGDYIMTSGYQTNYSTIRYVTQCP